MSRHSKIQLPKKIFVRKKISFKIFRDFCDFWENSILVLLRDFSWAFMARNRAACPGAKIEIFWTSSSYTLCLITTPFIPSSPSRSTTKQDPITPEVICGESIKNNNIGNLFQKKKCWHLFLLCVGNFSVEHQSYSKLRSVDDQPLSDNGGELKQMWLLLIGALHPAHSPRGTALAAAKPPDCVPAIQGHGPHSLICGGNAK